MKQNDEAITGTGRKKQVTGWCPLCPLYLYCHACRERTGGDSGRNNYLPGLPEFPTTLFKPALITGSFLALAQLCTFASSYAVHVVSKQLLTDLEGLINQLLGLNAHHTLPQTDSPRVPSSVDKHQSLYSGYQ